jgi:hypothetical protein
MWRLLRGEHLVTGAETGQRNLERNREPRPAHSRFDQAGDQFTGASGANRTEPSSPTRPNLAKSSWLTVAEGRARVAQRKTVLALSVATTSRSGGLKPPALLVGD